MFNPLPEREVGGRLSSRIDVNMKLAIFVGEPRGKTCHPSICHVTCGWFRPSASCWQWPKPSPARRRAALVRSECRGWIIPIILTEIEPFGDVDATNMNILLTRKQCFGLHRVHRVPVVHGFLSTVRKRLNHDASHDALVSGY